MKSLDISHFPEQPGVYIFKDKKGAILYIGKAKNLKKRVKQYFSPGSVWKQEMVAQAQSVEFIVVENESESLYLESNLIKKHLPPFNNMLKGANAYAYIKLTKHLVPQIFITRKKINDGGTYIGPKHQTRELKKFLQYLRQVVQYRTCPLSQFNQGKVCSDYYFGLCKGWCQFDNLGEPEYPKLITNFFKGNTSPIEKKIKELMKNAIDTQNFEWAAKLRDIFYQIDQFTEKQSVEFAKNFSGYLLQIREIGSWRVYVLLHFYEGKMIDIIRHHFEKDEIDEETMVVSLSSEIGEISKDDGWYSTFKFTGNKEDKQRMLQLFDDFFDSYLLVTTLQGGGVMSELLSLLQERYNLSQFPYQVECLDISHLGGDWTSGGLSAISGGLPDKNHYRKYKITSSTNDDYLSLKEVLLRRFRIGEEYGELSNDEDEKNSKVLYVPNVFILDGGRGQLSIIPELLTEFPEFERIMKTVQFCALGKGEARHKANIGKYNKKKDDTVGEKLYVYKNGHILEHSLIYDDADKILVKLRDEAHRFANSYRRKQEELSFNAAKKKAEKILDLRKNNEKT